MRTEISMESIEELARKADLKQSDFTEPQYFHAWIYRILIWTIICHFSNKGRNLKSSEFSTDANGKVVEILMIVEINEEALPAVAYFLRSHDCFIPSELRQMFEFSVRYRYDDGHAFTIGRDSITPYDWTREEYDGGVLTDTIIEESTYAKISTFRNSVKELLSQDG